MADMDPIIEIARAHGLYVIEDACQAHGAEYKGRMAGSIGDAGCFSFYPGKNLGAYGEGGAVVTNNPELAEKIRRLRDHGQEKKYYHQMIGWNARMEGLQGAILSVKLKHLPQWNEARRGHARLYDQLLRNGSAVILPEEMAAAKHVYHVYAIRVPNRDRLMNNLATQDIHCGIHYPLPIHLQAAYHFLNLKVGAYPVAEKCAAEFLSLPMYPELTAAQIQFAADAIQKSLSI
jgi:dTDP-4-amino-4,6-dideoxygalactose transaminase